MSAAAIQTWHHLVQTLDPSGLDSLLADEVVFLSPVVHTPQVGKAIAKAYLGAAFKVLFIPTFKYVREIIGSTDAMLEFETTLDGVLVNGVDIIKWNQDNQIIDFKVMVRPLKGITVIHERMAAMLAGAGRAR